MTLAQFFLRICYIFYYVVTNDLKQLQLKNFFWVSETPKPYKNVKKISSLKYLSFNFKKRWFFPRFFKVACRVRVIYLKE